MASSIRSEKARYFDGIAEQYGKTDTGVMPVRCYSEVFTLAHILGDVVGQAALDLGCSDGFFTRELKRRGMARVLGVDVSARMIELALQDEDEEPLGVDYLLSDALDLGVVGEFDLVISAFLLNFAQTRDELREMCRMVSANLKPGGRFVGIVDHPALTPDAGARFEKYGLTKSFTPPLRDGAPLTVSLILAPGRSRDGERITFEARFFTQAAFEAAFEEAGFREIRWHAPKISPAGVRRFGNEFWQEYLAHPSSAFVECRLPAG